MLPLVEFCTNNAFGYAEAIALLEADGRVEVNTLDCLSECTICAQILFAVCEGEVIRAQTPELLVAQIFHFLTAEGYLE